MRDTDALAAGAAPAASPEELLLRVIDAQDHYTFGHSRRVARHAENLAAELGLSPSQRSIPLAARILAVADAWDAMTVTRPYRQALTHKQARVELKAAAGSQLNPPLVPVFLGLT